MGRLIPKPPGLTKEQSKKWDKNMDNYYKFMIIGISIAAFLFAILIMIILYVKFIR